MKRSPQLACPSTHYKMNKRLKESETLAVSNPGSWLGCQWSDHSSIQMSVYYRNPLSIIHMTAGSDNNYVNDNFRLQGHDYRNNSLPRNDFPISRLNMGVASHEAQEAVCLLVSTL